jgi:hypothetical protein
MERPPDSAFFASAMHQLLAEQGGDGGFCVYAIHAHSLNRASNHAVLARCTGGRNMVKVVANEFISLTQLSELCANP